MTRGVVVVGGGFAALEIALSLRKGRRDIPVSVVSTETEATYRPWLIKLPASGAQPPVIPFARLLAEAGVELVTGVASSVDLDARRLVLASGSAVEYRQLVVATGASADRDRVPGARQHALFPCERADAVDFAVRVASGVASVAVVFGWERPGPGLEYAAWIARHRPGVRVTAIDADGTLERLFGEAATARIRIIFERRGGQLLSDGPVMRIAERTVELSSRAIVADLVALASPLCGNTAWLPRAALDERGMLRIDSAMAASNGVFGIGDVVAAPEDRRLPPTLQSIRSTAGRAAANLARAFDGSALKPVLMPGRPDLVGPDLAGDAVFVRDRRLVMSGRLPLLIRSIMDRRYLSLRKAHPARDSGGA